MREIPLTQGKVALVDDADFERVSQFKWHAFRKKNTCYAARNVLRDETGKQTKTLMHNFLLGGRADHTDGNGLDNRRSNIRLSTQQQNRQAYMTKPAGCSSRYRGVSWDKRARKWRASIQLALRNKKYLGLFCLEEDAARAYNVAALSRNPQFCHLNLV